MKNFEGLTSCMYCMGVYAENETLQDVASIQCTNLWVSIVSEQHMKISLTYPHRAVEDSQLHTLHVGCAVCAELVWRFFPYTLWYLHRLMHWNWTM